MAFDYFNWFFSRKKHPAQVKLSVLLSFKKTFEKKLKKEVKSFEV